MIVRIKNLIPHILLRRILLNANANGTCLISNINVSAEPKDETSSRADEPLPINPTDSLRMLHECKLAVIPDEDGDL